MLRFRLCFCLFHAYDESLQCWCVWNEGHPFFCFVCVQDWSMYIRPCPISKKLIELVMGHPVFRRYLFFLHHSIEMLLELLLLLRVDISLLRVANLFLFQPRTSFREYRHPTLFLCGSACKPSSANLPFAEANNSVRVSAMS